MALLKTVTTNNENHLYEHEKNGTEGEDGSCENRPDDAPLHFAAKVGVASCRNSIYTLDG